MGVIAHNHFGNIWSGEVINDLIPTANCLLATIFISTKALHLINMMQINMCVCRLECPLLIRHQSSHHFSPSYVVKVVFRNLVRTKLIES